MSSSISDANATKLNKMNKASQNVNLGTFLQGIEDNQDAFVSGSHLVYAADTNASKVTISTNLGSISGFILQVYSAGSQVYPGYYVDSASGSLVVTEVSGCSVLEANQKIYWSAWS